MMSEAATILAVDDQRSFLLLLRQQLEHAGFHVVTATDASEALEILARRPIDLVLSDLVMPTMDGLAFLGRVRAGWAKIPFIVITAQGSIASAVEALKRGAFDYVEKLCSDDELRLTVERALSYRRLESENEQFKERFQQQYAFHNIVTASGSMKQALDLAAQVTRSQRTTVALFGESGCGKEVLARAIHYSGGGMPGNFVGVNCAAVPATLIESELFGHVRGAFTGAERDREGKIAVARGGTLLLDEIGDLPLELQPKLLRVLEDRLFESVGSNLPQAVECRIIVATSRDVAALVAQGRFREDLYHRINVFPVVIPPLRERREDIPILTAHFMSFFREHLGKSLPGVSRSAMVHLLDYNWPGNVRELRNCLERAAILVPDGELIRPEHLAIVAPAISTSLAEVGSADASIEYHMTFEAESLSLEAITQRVLDLTLERCGGNKSKAAALLKVNRKAFYR